jgi:transcriptional regulator with XRE-family HTH domain
LSKVARRVGSRIRELRRQKGLTQEGLGVLARIDAKHVQTLEYGRTNPTLATLMSVAEALDVEIGDLFVPG